MFNAAMRASHLRPRVLQSFLVRFSTPRTRNQYRQIHPSPQVSQTPSYAATGPKFLKRLNASVGGKFVSLDNIFLRDACRCSRCVHPPTQNRLFRTTDIPLDIKPKVAENLSDGSLRVVWENDILAFQDGPPHESRYSSDFLLRCLKHRTRAYVPKQTLWDQKIIQEHALWLDYEDYIRSDKALLQSLKQLAEYGLLFIRGVPKELSSVRIIAERIGNLKQTFYGDTWDVKSIKDSKNIAYTALDLGLHMDIVYFESPPGIQFLHCVENSTTGGSSIFADSFRAANIVRINSQMLFHSLTTFPVTFHYKNDGQHYRFTRPTVVLDAYSPTDQEQSIAHVNWAPPFQAPFEVDIGSSNTSKFRSFISAAKAFASELDNPSAQHELRLRAGECVVFNNRRVVHARRAFDPLSGDRWLRGAYIDLDTFHSKHRVLSEQQRVEDEYSYIQ